MPHLLARLGPHVETGRRVIFARAEERKEEVQGEAAALRDGTVALLEGVGPPWRAAREVILRPWPRGLPGILSIKKANGRHLRLEVGPPLSSHGVYCLDERDHPCEVATGRPDAPFRFLINYAGWRLSDVPAGNALVLIFELPDGPVAVLPPRSVPRPAVERAQCQTIATPAPIATPPPSVGHVRIAVPRRWELPHPKLPPPPQLPAPPHDVWVSKRFRWTEVDFDDGILTIEIDDQPVSIKVDDARAIYQDIRTELDQEIPEGIVVRGRLRGRELLEPEVEGTSRLEAIFERVRRQRVIDAARLSEEWLDAHDLCTSLTAHEGPYPSEDLEPLFSIEGLGQGKRAEAFRLLFRHRDRSQRVYILPARAALVPLPSADNGPCWYAWEVVKENNATWLFRPASRDTLERVLNRTQDPGLSRARLLQDRGLAAELDFRGRVLHRDDDLRALGRWWHDLCQMVSLRT